MFTEVHCLILEHGGGRETVRSPGAKAPANPVCRADPQDCHMQGTQHHGEENQKEHSPPGHPPASSSPNTSSLHCCVAFYCARYVLWRHGDPQSWSVTF